MNGGLCFHYINQFDYLSLKENRGLKVCLFSKLFFLNGKCRFIVASWTHNGHKRMINIDYTMMIYDDVHCPDIDNDLT